MVLILTLPILLIFSVVALELEIQFPVPAVILVQHMYEYPLLLSYCGATNVRMQDDEKM